MDEKPLASGPIMRMFQVKIKQGHAETLLTKFATTSVDVVRNESGNLGYFFGKGVELDNDRLIFTSIWKDLDAVKNRFGEDWQKSYLPEGYEDLVEEYSVQHIDVTNGWYVLWDS